MGYMDHLGKQPTRLDTKRKYMYGPDGSFYGYVSGVGKKYLYTPSGEIIRYFKPGFLA